MKLLDLNGPWQMKQTMDSEWVPALVPGSVYNDLLVAERMEDPFFRDNELTGTPARQREVYLEYGLDVQGKTVCCDTVLFVKPKHFMFKEPQIELEVQDLNEEFQVTLTAAAFAKFVELELDLDIDGGIFSDNYFHLSAGEARSVTIKKRHLPENISVESLHQNLSVRSIYDIDEFSS